MGGPRALSDKRFPHWALVSPSTASRREGAPPYFCPTDGPARTSRGPSPKTRTRAPRPAPGEVIRSGDPEMRPGRPALSYVRPPPSRPPMTEPRLRQCLGRAPRWPRRVSVRPTLVLRSQRRGHRTCARLSCGRWAKFSDVKGPPVGAIGRSHRCAEGPRGEVLTGVAERRPGVPRSVRCGSVSGTSTVRSPRAPISTAPHDTGRTSRHGPHLTTSAVVIGVRQVLAAPEFTFIPRTRAAIAVCAGCGGPGEYGGL